MVLLFLISLLPIASLSFASKQPPRYSRPHSCCSTHDIGFDPIAAANKSRSLSSHSWEFGTLSEALLELYNPNLAVFSSKAFPNRKLPAPELDRVEALQYAWRHIRLNSSTLIDGDGSTGDPASLGVSALLIGQTVSAYNDSAVRQWESLNDPTTTPHWSNGAMSHRSGKPALWSDFIFMAPPFIAYYAVATQNDSYLQVALRQCLLYRQVLRTNGTDCNAWEHIVGGPQEDLGHWSTGNGWAAMGMARVLATLIHWKPLVGDDSKNARMAAGDMFTWIGEILQAAEASDRGKNGLLRNYWGEDTWEGEISGTALVTAAVYRLAVLQEEATVVFDQKGGNYTKPVTPELLNWADKNRDLVSKHVNALGVGTPAVNPVNWHSHKYVWHGSPEGQSFLVMLYAAWRDCVVTGRCASPPPSKRTTMQQCQQPQTPFMGLVADVLAAAKLREINEWRGYKPWW